MDHNHFLNMQNSNMNFYNNNQNNSQQAHLANALAQHLVQAQQNSNQNAYNNNNTTQNQANNGGNRVSTNNNNANVNNMSQFFNQNSQTNLQKLQQMQMITQLQNAYNHANQNQNSQNAANQNHSHVVNQNNNSQQQQQQQKTGNINQGYAHSNNLTTLSAPHNSHNQYNQSNQNANQNNYQNYNNQTQSNNQNHNPASQNNQNAFAQHQNNSQTVSHSQYNNQNNYGQAQQNQQNNAQTTSNNQHNAHQQNQQDLFRQQMRQNLDKYAQQQQQQQQQQQHQQQNHQNAHQQNGHSSYEQALLNQQQNQNGNASYADQLQRHMQQANTGQVGRPKGSTNKKKQLVQNQLLGQHMAGAHGEIRKKGSGRPPKSLDEKKKKKKENHVKRPMTAYLYFVSKYRQQLKDNNQPVPKAKEMTQECAQRWRVMTKEQKAPYESLAKTDRVRWETEKNAAEKPKDPARPKRPPSAYFLFLDDFRSKYPNKTDPAKEITKAAGAKWNEMTEVDKLPYQEAAKIKRNEWEEALKEYKMKTENQPNLLNRNSGLATIQDIAQHVLIDQQMQGLGQSHNIAQITSNNSNDKSNDEPGNSALPESHE